MAPLPEPPSPFRDAPEPPPRRGNVVRRAAVLDVQRDNAAALLAMIGERADAETATAAIAAAAQGDQATVSLEQAASTATAAVTEARTSVGGALDAQAQVLEAGFGSAVAGVEGQGAAASAAVEASAAAASGEIDSHRAAGRAGVEAELEARATNIEAAGEADELEAAANSERAVIDATAARVIVNYASHEKAADVRAAVQDSAANAKAELDRGKADAASESRQGAAQAAASARDAMAQQAGQVDTAATEAQAHADAEREQLLAGLNDNATQSVAALESGHAQAAGELEQRRGQADADLGAIETATGAAMAGATAATAQAAEDVNSKWTAGIEGWKGAADAEVAGVQAEVGNLFVPEEAAPVLDELGAEGETARAALQETVGRVTADHAAGAQGFAAALGSDAASATANQDVAAGVEALDAQATAVAGALEGAAGSAGAGFTQLGGEAGTAVGSVLDGVRSEGATGEQTVVGELGRASAGGAAQVHQSGAKAAQAMTQAADTAANANWLERWSVRIAEAIGTAVVAVMLSLANFCFGFLWGDPISEDYGGKWWAFAGDVVAGLLIFGDVRDLFKWGIWKPFVMGEGFGWENVLNIVMALWGLIPVIGDIRKGKKGFDLLIKTTRKTVVQKLGGELAERLIGEVGEEAALELAEKLGKEAIEKLLKSLDGKALKALSDELGPEVLKKLAAELEGATIKKLTADLGADTVKLLSKELDPKRLVEIAGIFDAALLKEVAASADGPKVFREMLENVDRKTLRKLVGELGWPDARALQVRWGKERFGKLLAHFTGREIVDFEDTLGKKLVGRLVDEIGADGFKETLTKFGQDLLAELADKVTSKQLKLLAQLNVRIVKLCPEESLPMLATLVERHGADAIETVLKDAAETMSEIIQNLFKDPAGRYLRCYQAFRWDLTNRLLSAMGEEALFAAEEAVGTAGIKEMLGKCRDAEQFARLCKKYGPEQLRAELAEVPHADWLEMQAVP